MGATPGSGAIVQLAALGKQDIVLRGRFSPFKIQYRRYVPFVTWTDEFQMQYAPLTRTRIDILKKGDFLCDMYLEIRLPSILDAPPGTTWNAYVGYRLIRRLRLLLNDQEIHNIERLWLHLYDQLYTKAGHEQGLSAMVGKTPLPVSTSHLLYIPLRFLTCRKGLARAPLPLHAMTSPLVLDIEWERPDLLCPVLETDPGLDIHVLCDFADVDGTVSSIQQPSQHVTTKLAFESVIDSDATTYAVDSDGALRDKPSINVNLGNARFSVKAIVWVAYAEDSGDLFQYIQQPLDDAYISFNSQERLRPKPSTYFELLQPYLYSNTCKLGPPSVYSFCLNMTSRLHTGSVDFGNLSEVSLKATVQPNNRYKLKVFCMYHNVLEIKNSTAKVLFV